MSVYACESGVNGGVGGWGCWWWHAIMQFILNECGLAGMIRALQNPWSRAGGGCVCVFVRVHASVCSEGR